jgi:hypothetical protein
MYLLMKKGKKYVGSSPADFIKKLVTTVYTFKGVAMFFWLISHQPPVFFSQNKSATSNQPSILFSQNKSAPTISHQPN